MFLFDVKQTVLEDFFFKRKTAFSLYALGKGDNILHTF